MFFNRILSDMILTSIKKNITRESFKKFQISRKDYELWDAHKNIKNDGPNLLWLIMIDINPINQAGAQGYKENIQNCTLEKYGHNVKNMLNEIVLAVNKITQSGETHQDLLLHIFDALVTSNNSIFCYFIQRLRDSL